MIQLYHIIFYQPLYNVFVYLYNIIPGNDVGLAIILLTIILKVVLFPFSLKSLKAQKAMQELQPKLEELKEKYKDNREQLARATMELYKAQKVNPLSSCFPLLIQLPFFFAMYRVFRSGLTEAHFEFLYPFINNPGSIQSIWLGFVDLSKPNLVLAILAGLAQFWQAKSLTSRRPETRIKEARDEGTMAIMNKQMTYVMPFITVVIGFSLPGGLMLYWLATTLLTLLQQKLFFRTKKEAPASV